MERRLTWKCDLDGMTDVGLRDGVTVGDAICRLADIESILGDEYSIDHLRELVQAEKDGRVVVFPPIAKEGDSRPECFYNDNSGIWCLGMAPADMDEPTERCKNCWYCESGYYADTSEEAKAALKGESNA